MKTELSEEQVVRLMAQCGHPLDKLLWYDEALHCFDCRKTWLQDFPEHAGVPKIWGRPDYIPDWSI